MKIKTIGYLIKEGLRGMFRHGFMSFAAVVVTVACLLIVGTFACLIYNLNIMVDELNHTNEVLAYVDETLTDDQARSIGTEINRINNVNNATFMDRETALKNFIAEYDNAAAFEGTEADVLQHRFVVVLKDNRQLDQTVKDLKKIEGVEDVVAFDELAKGFSTVQDILQMFSVVIIGVLLVVSLLIISNTVKLAMYDRKEEISIMKMVGATNSFIRLPFVVEGFVLGMLAAAVSFCITWLLYNAMVTRIVDMDTLNLIELVPFTQPELLWPMVATFGAAGMFVGVCGSWTSIRKFMSV